MSGRRSCSITASSSLRTTRPRRFTRRSLGPKDVHIKITHAGMCHSDLHTIRGDWGPANYPLVPGCVTVP